MALLVLGLVMAATPEVPAAFEMPFQAQDEAVSRAWQERVRARLFEIVEAQNPRQDPPLDIVTGEAADRGDYTQADLEFTSNEGGRIEATLTVPKGAGPFPAIICLHGHGGDRHKVHDPATEYKGFAAEFARRGFVTLSPTLAHYEYAPNQLWNLMRLVDVLETALCGPGEDRRGRAEHGRGMEHVVGGVRPADQGGGGQRLDVHDRRRTERAELPMLETARAVGVVRHRRGSYPRCAATLAHRKRN